MPRFKEMTVTYMHMRVTYMHRFKRMTVTYMQHVHTANFGSFIRLLALWRGSIFKGIGRNILVRD